MKFFFLLSSIVAFSFASCTTPATSDDSGGKNIEIEETDLHHDTSAIYLPMP